MMQAGTDDFVDYYDVLQVNPACDGKILEAAYHYLAKIYHPDRIGTANTDRFHEVTEAYRVLRNPERRADYDKLYARNKHLSGASEFPTSVEGGIDDQAALDDADDHARILNYLYAKRRENAQNAGVVGFYIQELLQCSDERFDFHKWYLKEKKYIVTTEQGTLAITVEGIDHLIASSRNARVEKLRLQQGPGSDGVSE